MGYWWRRVIRELDEYNHKLLRGHKWRWLCDLNERYLQGGG